MDVLPALEPDEVPQGQHHMGPHEELECFTLPGYVVGRPGAQVGYVEGVTVGFDGVQCSWGMTPNEYGHATLEHLADCRMRKRRRKRGELG